MVRMLAICVLCVLAPGFKDEAVKFLVAATFQPYGEIAVMRADRFDVHLLTDNSTEEGAPTWVPQHRH